MLKKYLRVNLFRAVFLVSAFFVFSAVTQAATYTVNTTDDDSSYDCVTTTDCSLRGAVETANSTPDDDEIVFADSMAHYYLTELDVSGSIDGIYIQNNGSLTITGNGSGNTIIDGESASVIFEIYDATVTITGVSLVDTETLVGFMHGALYLDNADLTMEDVLFENNRDTAVNMNGSVAVISDSVFQYNIDTIEIDSSSELTISDSLFSRNSGDTYGTILNDGGVFIVNKCVFVNNDQGVIWAFGGGVNTIRASIFAENSTDFSGGAILAFQEDTVTVVNSTFINNFAEEDGGAIFIDYGGSLSVSGSQFTSNESFYGYGGAIAVINDSDGEPPGSLVLTDSVLIGNSSSYGGAVYGDYSQMDITDSTFAENNAFFGGAIYSEGESEMELVQVNFYYNESDSDGGAISTDTDSFTRIRMTDFVGNVSGRYGGAIDNQGEMDIVNTTISGNTAEDHGGGIYNYAVGRDAGIMNLSFVTIADNTADSDGDGVGEGGGIYNVQGEVLLRATILADNVNSTAPNCSVNPYTGTIASDDYNVIDDLTGCDFTLGRYDYEEDPGLYALADNGGDTLTHAISSSSVAIDLVPSSVCTTIGGLMMVNDQRNRLRLSDAVSSYCDAGAYEWQLKG